MRPSPTLARTCTTALVFAFACSFARESRSDDGRPAPERPKEAKTEVGFVPIVGGDSDVGIGGGVVGTITRLDPKYDDYLWKLDASGVITFKGGDADGFRVPYQDYLATLTLPHLAGGRVRLEIKPEFTNETTLKFFGFGNASIAPETTGRGNEYGRIHPMLSVRTRVRLVPHVDILVGVAYTHNWLAVRSDATVAERLRAAEGAERDLFRQSLKSLDPHGLAHFEYGLVFDSRDDETTTLSGQFHQAKVRLSPGGTPEFPYRYAQFDVNLRAYVPIVGRRLSMAVRLVGDAIVGDAPFYELAKFDDFFALGGTFGVRGIPAQRYYGKIKTVGNVEFRSEFASFRMFGKEFGFGLAAFFDAGRVWADWTPAPELDGTGAGIKFGVGGGPRLRQGRSFLVRGDVAWSPDARPIGAYFAAGQAF